MTLNFIGSIPAPGRQVQAGGALRSACRVHNRSDASTWLRPGSGRKELGLAQRPLHVPRHVWLSQPPIGRCERSFRSVMAELPVRLGRYHPASDVSAFVHRQWPFQHLLESWFYAPFGNHTRTALLPCGTIKTPQMFSLPSVAASGDTAVHAGDSSGCTRGDL